jgi:hypothetical protein
MEVWKDIKDFEDSYEVSTLGRVRSKDRMVSTGRSKRLLKSQILKGELNRYGYHAFRLWKNNKLLNVVGHRLVAIAFISNPDNKKEVNHKNGIKHDNRLENLEWNTRSENAKHAFLVGLEKPKRVFITEDIFNKILKEIQEGSPILKTCNKYKCSRTIYYYRKKYGYRYKQN